MSLPSFLLLLFLLGGKDRESHLTGSSGLFISQYHFFLFFGHGHVFFSLEASLYHLFLSFILGEGEKQLSGACGIQVAFSSFFLLITTLTRLDTISLMLFLVFIFLLYFLGLFSGFRFFCTF